MDVRAENSDKKRLFQGRGPPGRGKKCFVVSREQMRRLFRDEWLTEKGSMGRYRDVFVKEARVSGEDAGLFFLYVPTFTTHLYWMSRRPDDVLGITDARVETVYDVAKRVLVFLQGSHARVEPYLRRSLSEALYRDWVRCFDQHVLAWMTHMSVKRYSTSRRSDYSRDTRSAYPPCAL